MKWETACPVCDAPCEVDLVHLEQTFDDHQMRTALRCPQDDDERHEQFWRRDESAAQGTA